MECFFSAGIVLLAIGILCLAMLLLVIEALHDVSLRLTVVGKKKKD